PSATIAAAVSFSCCRSMFSLLRPFASSRLCPRVAPWRGDAAAVAPPFGPLVSSFRLGGTLAASREREYDQSVIRRLGVSVLVIAALAPVLSGDAAPPALIPQGVTVAGVPVGGMSNEQAQAALGPAFAKPVRLVYGDRSWRLRPARFGARVTIAQGVATALQARAGAAVVLTPRIDENAVHRFVRALDKRISFAAKDAELAGLEGLQPKFTPEQAGVQVLRQLTAQRITRALQSPQIHRIRVAAKPVEPSRT